jgi:hypothetical protein
MTPPVSPEHILKTLARHGVDYVVIGAVGAILQGVELPRTLDLDVAASPGRTNLKKLSAALKDMGAQLRLVTAPDPDPPKLRSMSGCSPSLRDHHDHALRPLRRVVEPPGMPPYKDLKRRANHLKRFGLEILVASLEDIVASKRVAGREKDAAHLTILLEHMRSEQEVD